MNEENLAVLRVSKDIGQPGNNGKTERKKGREGKKERERGRKGREEREEGMKERREEGLEKKGW